MEQPKADGSKKPYEPPKLESYSAAAVLEQLGPAKAIYGEIP